MYISQGQMKSHIKFFYLGLILLLDDVDEKAKFMDQICFLIQCPNKNEAWLL